MENAYVEIPISNYLFHADANCSFSSSSFALPSQNALQRNPKITSRPPKLVFNKMSGRCPRTPYSPPDTRLRDTMESQDLAALKHLMVTDPALFCYENGIPETPLHVACSVCNPAAFPEAELDIVRFLLQNGARINVHTLDVFSTPLHEAARHGKVEIVRFLLENGADDTWAEGATPHLKTALEAAIETGQLGVVEVFRGRGGASAERMIAKITNEIEHLNRKAAGHMTSTL